MYFKCITVTRCLQGSIATSCVFVFIVTTVSGILLILAPEEPSLDLGGGSEYGLYPGVAMLVLAVTTVLLSIAGFFCVSRDSRIGLCLYSVLVLLVSILMLGLASVLFTFTYSGVIGDRLNHTLWTRIQNTHSPSQREKVFEIQGNYSCCGVDRPSDWFDESVKWNSSHLPSSCCENEEEVENCTLIDAHSDGCKEVLMRRLQIVVDVSFGTAVIGSLLLLTVSILSGYGSSLIKKYYNYDVL